MGGLVTPVWVTSTTTFVSPVSSDGAVSVLARDDSDSLQGGTKLVVVVVVVVVVDVVLISRRAIAVIFSPFHQYG